MSTTLSAAVRSNLLSLQNTASLLDTTQTRLATGNKVNSALDNPTNYFTASALNSRASDLGQLLDSVSNAVQTLAAANNGITSITKLVESAQATARQALQTSATVDSTTGAATLSLATAATSNTTSLTIVADVALATATDDTSNTTSLTIADGAAATQGTFTAGAFTTVDISGGGDSIAFSVNVDGGGAQAVTIDSAAITAYNLANGTSISDSALTAQNIADLTNDQLTSNAVSVSGGALVFTGGAAGASSSVAVTGYAATVTGGSTGIANNSDTGTATVTDTSGDVTINGQTISLAAGDNAAAILTKFQAAATASSGTNAFTVSNNAGVLTITGTSGNDLAIGGDAGTLAAVGLASGTINGTPAADNNAGNLTINGQTIALAGGDNAAAILTKIQAAATASSGTSAFTVSNASGVLTITGTAGNDVVIGGDAATVSALGLTSGTVDGTPASAGTTTQIANPKRADLVTQYNDLLDQIDQLTKDSGFNGVNLLNSDNLSVLFNEDGSSKLAITGADTSSSGLGLTTLASTAFDTNTSINGTLDDLKASIDTLRSQASKFGSNLSVVQIRQDFTKAIINTLQTGASNLTLADSNEEAANLLALQTRQSLSTKALSLASQSDQNVLRLLQ